MSGSMVLNDSYISGGVEPKKKSFLVSLVVLAVVIGFPRIYGTEVPMASLLIPFYMLGFMRFLKRNGSFAAIFILLFTSWVIGGALAASAGTVGDLFFHLVVSSKIFLNVFFGYVIFHIVQRKPSVLLCWVLIQCALAVASVLNRDIYILLLGFISPRSAEVFQHIFGLRALGFGLFHVDGALTLIIALFYYLLITRQGALKNVLIVMIFPIAMAIARSAIIPFAILGSSRRGMGFKVILLLALVAMVIMSFYVTSGAFYQATEIFRNLIDSGELRSNSVTSLSYMYALPDHFSTYLFGDGRYFSENTSVLGFYKGTDVGYLRLLYFSGLGSVFVFLLLNSFYVIATLFSGRYEKSGDVKIFAMAMFVIFIIINFKGLQVMPVFAVTAYLYALSKRRDVMGYNLD